LILLALTGLAGAAAELRGRVVGVHDGDTLTLLDAGNRQIKIRLNQIDAPELGQDFGRASKQSLADLVFGKEVRVVVADTDKYSRTVGTVWNGTRDVNLAQIQSGMAWAYRKYLRDPAYLDAETAAKNARKGLWSQPAALPPWEYRHPERRAGGILPPPPPPAGQRSAKPAGYGTKRFCREMATCTEARFYLETCGVRGLDGNGDGQPCESLCR
jgi:endonuclease YncB( thermonuclease family)